MVVNLADHLGVTLIDRAPTCLGVSLRAANLRICTSGNRLVRTRRAGSLTAGLRVITCDPRCGSWRT